MKVKETREGSHKLECKTVSEEVHRCVCSPVESNKRDSTQQDGLYRNVFKYLMFKY